jgi:hypothetical protein
VKLETPRFDRKSLSEKNEKLDNLSAISNVRLVVGGAIVVEDDIGLVDMLVVVVGGSGGGIAAVASGRTPIVDDISTGMTRAGFLINDKNKCHKSSGIAELSISNSRNCRKLW